MSVRVCVFAALPMAGNGISGRLRAPAFTASRLLCPTQRQPTFFASRLYRRVDIGRHCRLNGGKPFVFSLPSSSSRFRIAVVGLAFSRRISVGQTRPGNDDRSPLACIWLAFGRAWPVPLCRRRARTKMAPDTRAIHYVAAAAAAVASGERLACSRLKARQSLGEGQVIGSQSVYAP